MNSFDSDVFFYPSLSNKLSSNAFVVVILLSEQISYWGACPGMIPKNENVNAILNFLEIDRESLFNFWESFEMFGKHPDTK